jgi:hypothetical protein
MCEGENFKLNFSLSGQKKCKIFPYREKKGQKVQSPIVKIENAEGWGLNTDTLSLEEKNGTFPVYAFKRLLRVQSNFHASNGKIGGKIKTFRYVYTCIYVYKIFLRLQSIFKRSINFLRSILSVQSKKLNFFKNF